VVECLRLIVRYRNSNGIGAFHTDVATRAVGFAMGAYVWLLPEVSGRVTGVIGRTMADRMGQDCGTYVGGRYPVIRRGPSGGWWGACGGFSEDTNHGRGRSGFGVM
jgi:hypothetical protein